MDYLKKILGAVKNFNHGVEDSVDKLFFAEKAKKRRGDITSFVKYAFAGSGVITRGDVNFFIKRMRHHNLYSLRGDFDGFVSELLEKSYIPALQEEIRGKGFITFTSFQEVFGKHFLEQANKDTLDYFNKYNEAHNTYMSRECKKVFNSKEEVDKAREDEIAAYQKLEEITEKYMRRTGMIDKCGLVNELSWNDMRKRQESKGR